MTDDAVGQSCYVGPSVAGGDAYGWYSWYEIADGVYYMVCDTNIP
jgi:hypothetical protein